MVCPWRHEDGEGLGGHLRPQHLNQLENKNFDWFPAIVPVPGTVLDGVSRGKKKKKYSRLQYWNKQTSTDRGTQDSTKLPAAER